MIDDQPKKESLYGSVARRRVSLSVHRRHSMDALFFYTIIDRAGLGIDKYLYRDTRLSLSLSPRSPRRRRAGQRWMTSSHSFIH